MTYKRHGGGYAACCRPQFAVQCTVFFACSRALFSSRISREEPLALVALRQRLRYTRTTLRIYESGGTAMQEKHCSIGVDLGGTNLKIAVYRKPDYTKIYERRAPVQSDDAWEYILKRIHAEITNVFDFSGIPPADTACIGMGIPGLLDSSAGVSLFSPNFAHWKNVPIVSWLQERIPLPVFIDNDVRVNLYGEWLYGAGKGKQNIVLITLGTGLGAAVIADGHVLCGATASAGEIGHMHMVHDGRPCSCGSSGCLGRYVSARGMVRTFKEKLAAGQSSVVAQWVQGDPEKITALMISQAYDLHDAAAESTMCETGELLGWGLVNVINLYNPELIIIGGGMAAAGERLLGPARSIVAAHALAIPRERCRIVLAALGDAAGMLGAALYADWRLSHGITQ